MCKITEECSARSSKSELKWKIKLAYVNRNERKKHLWKSDTAEKYVWIVSQGNLHD